MDAARKSASVFFWSNRQKSFEPRRVFEDTEIVPRGCLLLAVRCRDRALLAARRPFCEAEVRFERQEMRLWAKRWRLRTETCLPPRVARQSVFAGILREAAL